MILFIKLWHMGVWEYSTLRELENQETEGVFLQQETKKSGQKINVAPSTWK